MLGSSLGGSICIMSYNKKINAMVLWDSVINLKQTFAKLIMQKNVQKIEENGFIIFKDIRSNKIFKIGKKFGKRLKI